MKMTTAQRADVRTYLKMGVSGAIVCAVAYVLWQLSDDDLLKTIFFMALGFTGFEAYCLLLIGYRHARDVRRERRVLRAVTALAVLAAVAMRETVRSCGCACATGGFCGGCGHAGCGRR